MVANPQLENGYTRLANSILEALYQAAPRLSGTEVAAILFIVRSTYGWKRKEVDISIMCLAQELGVTKKQAKYVLDELINRHKILIQINPPKGTLPRRVAFNKDYDSWRTT